MRFMLALVGEFNMRWGWDRKKLTEWTQGGTLKICGKNVSVNGTYYDFGRLDT